jgi:hypothetical protein
MIQLTNAQQEKLTKIFTYCQLLINEIDDVDIAKNETTQNIYDKCTALQEDLIVVVDQFYQNKVVSRETIFLELQQKTDYNFKKAFSKGRKK